MFTTTLSPRRLRARPRLAVPVRGLAQERPRGWNAMLRRKALVAALVLGLAVHSSSNAQESAAMYRVQPGDTLGGIALKLDVPVERLVALNGLSEPDLIRAGQQLQLPLDGTYRVRPGDSLGGIALRTGIPLSQLVASNNLTNPDVIVAGRVLRLGAPDQQVAAASVPEVRWVPSPHVWTGRPHGPPIALVLHTMEGRLSGADAWFTDPTSEVSAHYGIAVDGRVHQYVQLEDRAWANGRIEPGHRWPGSAGDNPNHLSVSIETEDLGDPAKPVPDTQYRAVLAVGRQVLQRYPQIRYLVTHRAISPRTRPDDPGASWLDSGRFAELARALGLQAIP